MNNKGWSIIELITAVGVLGVLSSIAIMSYMKYYQKGQFTKIHQTAKNFASSVEACLLIYDHEPKRCAFFDKLKFTCEHCESKVWFRPGTPGTPPDLGDSFLIDLTVAEYRATVIYRSATTPRTPIQIQRTGTSQKFCAAAIDGGSSHKTIRPTKTCDANSDCGTGEVCHLFPMTNWGGTYPSPWEDPTI